MATAARRSGEVIAGNSRLKAALSLGMTEAPVVWFDGTDLEATAYSIADNKTHEFATWDEPALAKLLDELRAEDALEGVGFSTDEIDELIAQVDAQINGPREVDDQGPEVPPVHPVSRTGDLWLLGDHRLLCGNSTKSEDIARVLGGDNPLGALDGEGRSTAEALNRPEGESSPLPGIVLPLAWRTRPQRGSQVGAYRVLARVAAARCSSSHNCDFLTTSIGGRFTHALADRHARFP